MSSRQILCYFVTVNRPGQVLSESQSMKVYFSPCSVIPNLRGAHKHKRFVRKLEYQLILQHERCEMWCESM